MSQTKTVYISEDLHSEVRLQAARDNKPLSVVAELALRRGLREMNRPRKKSEKQMEVAK